MDGIDRGTRGTYYFDAFVSRRETYIGMRKPGGVMLGMVGQGLESIQDSENFAAAQKSLAAPASVPQSTVVIEGTPETTGLRMMESPPAMKLAEESPLITTTVVISYTYDPLNRLTVADYDDGTYFHYTYDAVGNQLEEDTNGWANEYDYDAANRLVEVNGVDYLWDDKGNLLSDGFYTYTYDTANRLAGVSGAGQTVSYSYNGLGDRLSETVNGVPKQYTMDLNAGLTQVLQDGTNTYLYGNGRIAQYGASGAEYFLGDALGSVRQMVDEEGNLTLGKKYEPYGEVLVEAGDGATSYGFTGEWMSQGLIYLRARWYSPQSGRFLSKDIWLGDFTRPLSLNGWNYVKANPINTIDPSGFVACEPKFDYCKIVDGPYAGFFIDIDHWDNSKQLSDRINRHLQELMGVYLGKFKEGVFLGRYVPYFRTYYTAIPLGTSIPVLDGITLGILMDYNISLEKFEGIDPHCWTGLGCSSFSIEDLPSAYLGFVSYRNSWNLKETLRILVQNVDEDTEGTNQFPASIVERLLDAQNYCFIPKIWESSEGQFVYHPWPTDILYDAIGPGKYWATSPTAFVQPIPTPSSPGFTPTP